jgi:DNA-binding NarL/FixJ family response regulator
MKKTHRILCIEDDRETAGLIAEDLGDRGYEVVLAYDGTQGFAELLRTRPHLVLCDINMPGMSGFEILEALTSIAPTFSAMPFIFLTALSDRDTELKGRRLGADDYVTKPIDFEILASILHARLQRIARLDAWSQSIDLTPREIETLTWSARGKTSDEIATILSLSKRTVDFHIDNARAKLGVTSRVQAAVKAATGGLIEP